MINHISASDFYLNINNKQVTKIFSFKLSYKPPEPKVGPGLAQINFENLQKKHIKNWMEKHLFTNVVRIVFN